jgi:type II secretory ATPase GspE/PulE/Tfp pilus assembly ATPase PilB-like protein
MANLNIIEKRLPQDGRMSVRLLGQAVEFRISVVPLADGESIVLRLFQKKGEITLLDNLGFPAPYLESLRTSIRNPNGLILLTGPTGSGKTTTLNAIVRELSKDQVKVLTIEDPVENFITGVNQIQTNETVGMTFDTVLRRVLRQDPDILMVGEIRDQLTAELCLRSALTGHLVLSTLHTNDALSAIPRLIDMGTEPYLLSAVLRSCSAQRLVRILCPRCRKETRVSPAQAARLGALGTWAETHFEAVGCQECHHTGYAGRTVAGEIFAMDEAAAEMILGEKRRQDFVGHFRKIGCRFLADDLGVRVRAGQTSLEELERVVGTV